MEVELLAAPTDNFTLGGAIGYLDTEIKDEPACDPSLGFSGPTCIQMTGGFEVTAVGLDMPKAPELTANVFGEYRCRSARTGVVARVSTCIATASTRTSRR